jgi:sugar lactone lactonase YvrE
VSDYANQWTYKLPAATGGVASPAKGVHNGVDHGLALAGGQYFAATNTTPPGGGVYAFDPATLQLQTRPLAAPGYLNGVAGDPRTGDVYVTMSNAIMNATASPPTRFDQPSPGTSPGYDGLVWTADGSTLYAADFTNDALLGFDRGGAQSLRVDIGHQPDGIAVANPNTSVAGIDVSNNVFVVTTDGLIIRVDVNNGNAVSTVASGGGRGDFATVGPDNCLYATQPDRVEKLSPCFFQPVGKQSHLLAVTLQGSGGGTVTSDNPADLSCPSGQCSHWFPVGTTVKLTAGSRADSDFAGWGGDCAPAATAPVCQVVVPPNRDLAVSSTFALKASYQLGVGILSDNGGRGSVTDASGAIDCPRATCAATFRSGTVVTLTATPDAQSGSSFGSWTAPQCSILPTCTVTVAQSTTVQAIFGIPRVGAGPPNSPPVGNPGSPAAVTQTPTPPGASAGGLPNTSAAGSAAPSPGLSASPAAAGTPGLASAPIGGASPVAVVPVPGASAGAHVAGVPPPPPGAAPFGLAAPGPSPAALPRPADAPSAEAAREQGHAMVRPSEEVPVSGVLASGAALGLLCWIPLRGSRLAGARARRRIAF